MDKTEKDRLITLAKRDGFKDMFIGISMWAVTIGEQSPTVALFSNEVNADTFIENFTGTYKKEKKKLLVDDYLKFCDSSAKVRGYTARVIFENYFTSHSIGSMYEEPPSDRNFKTIVLAESIRRLI